ncbi:hypothetical protein [Cupriavidus basilensis]|uniref:hypothetical protein n=1 Tax=Cupriavidus basilensis TaxID=68895 RepID=UPI0039F72903
MMTLQAAGSCPLSGTWQVFLLVLLGEALTTCIARVDNGASRAFCQNRENCHMPSAVAVAVAAACRLSLPQRRFRCAPTATFAVTALG